MERRAYWSGFITAILVMIFVGGCSLCFWIMLGGTIPTNRNNRYDPGVVDSTVAMGEQAQSVLSDQAFVEKIMYIENIIDMYYVEDVTPDAVKNGILDGIMDSLGDDYADYYTTEELTEVASGIQGVYYGIGAYLVLDEEYKYPRITGLIKNSPAEAANLCVDDFIYSVDGVNVFNMPLDESVALIKGDEGTVVTLNIVRQATGEQFDVEIVRGKVESPTVVYDYYEDTDTAYIQITQFDDVTVGQFEEAMSEARADGMKGLIIDLRGNPGGSLPAAVDICSQLLPEGIVVYTMDKYGNREDYNCEGNSPLEVPLVVLVNGGSASASEIMSGAIKDYGVGTLLGTTTFGKGIVQKIIPLSDYSAVKLTVSHYYTPLGNDIHKVGIEPDVVVEFDVDAYLENDGFDNQIDEAIRILSDEIY